MSNPFQKVDCDNVFWNYGFVAFEYQFDSDHSSMGYHSFMEKELFTDESKGFLEDGWSTIFVDISVKKLSFASLHLKGMEHFWRNGIDFFLDAECVVCQVGKHTGFMVHGNS